MRSSYPILLLAVPALATIHVPLQRRANRELTAEDYQHHRAHLASKYNFHSSSRIKKRQNATASTVSTTNHDVDSSYSALMDIGTPPQTFSVILDTGSSDLWLAGSTCTNCDGMPLWNTASSSTFQQGSQRVSIKYGSGTASGATAADTVSMGAFTVPSQRMAVVTSLDDNLVVDGVSGLMGLGFQSIASTGALPWWQALQQGGVWTQPLMSFYFTRFLNQQGASSTEPGGVFTMGGTNTSFYTGDVDFVNLPEGTDGGFWMLPVLTTTANGQTLTISSTGNTVLGAIDTGTTLIGVPTEDIQTIYGAIPGSAPGTGQWNGFMTYPCSTTVNMTLNFGGRTWAVSEADFRIARVDRTTCAGGVFELNTGAGPGQPSWVIGDTFLKNVYSVFRVSPPSVGFATLAASGDGDGNLVTGSSAASRRANVPIVAPAVALAFGSTLWALVALFS